MEQTKVADPASRGHLVSHEQFEKQSVMTAQAIRDLFMSKGRASHPFTTNDGKVSDKVRCMKFEVKMPDSFSPILSCRLTFHKETQVEDLGVWLAMHLWTIAHYDVLERVCKKEIKSDPYGTPDLYPAILSDEGPWSDFVDGVVGYIPSQTIAAIKEKYGENNLKNFCGVALERMSWVNVFRQINDDADDMAPFLHRVYTRESPIILGVVGFAALSKYSQLMGIMEQPAKKKLDRLLVSNAK